jgi:hypothetical protein
MEKRMSTTDVMEMVETYLRCSDGNSPLAAFAARKTLNDAIEALQQNAYAKGRKDEADETKDAAAELRKAMGISQDFGDWPLSTVMAKAAERIRIQAATNPQEQQ